MSFAEISARIAQIQTRAQTVGAVRPAALARMPGSDFATTLAAETTATQGTTSATDLQIVDSGDGAGARMAALATQYVGVPYVAGGRSPKGWDCAGFTQWIAQQSGIDIPEVSWEQIKQGSPVASVAEAKPGDLLFFHEPSGHRRDPSSLKVNHVGIYLGNGKMVEAANPHAGTRISDVDTAHLVGIRRITGTAPTSYAGLTAPAGPTGLSSVRGIAATGADGALSPTQLRSVLQQAGFSGEGLRSAWALAMRESHGQPGAVGAVNPNGTRDHGLFQLNDIHLGRSVDPAQVYDPLANAQAAYKISKGGASWSAWGIGHSGWAGHLEQAQPAFYAKINASYQSWYDRFPGA